MLIPIDLDSPKLVHHLTLIFAISDLFLEIERRFLINFTIITYQLKFKYTLGTSSRPVLKYQRFEQILWCRQFVVCFQNALIYNYRYCELPSKFSI